MSESKVVPEACEVPLTELLRSIPIDHRVWIESIWSDDGTCIGHTHILVGHLMHRAANELELRAAAPAETVAEGAAMSDSKRRVVCAAIRAADGEVLIGIRHYSRDMHDQINARRDGDKFRHRHDADQGFVDQFGIFMSREEALIVASAAQQIINYQACGKGLNGPKLYSEGLY